MVVSKKYFLRILNSVYTINFNIYSAVGCCANYTYPAALKTL